MELYLKVIQLNLARFYVYPIEVISHVVKKIMTPVFLVVLWYAISQSSGKEINFREIVSYYLIASGINELLMARWGEFSRTLGNVMIRQGNLNNLLIKPVNIVFYTLAMSIGKNGVAYFFSFIMIGVGLLVNPPSSLFSILIAIIFAILGFCVSTAVNLFEATIYIYIIDASGLRSAVNHIKSILGGLFIPLSFFPDSLRHIVELSPFSSMIYLPTVAFKFNELNYEVMKFLFFSLLWAVVLNILAFNFWKISLKKYEAIGI